MTLAACEGIAKLPTVMEPSPDDVRSALAPFGVRQQKIVSGLFGAMIQNPSRVRDREWVSQQLTEMAVAAGEFEADSSTDAVQALQDFLQGNAAEMLNACFLLFQRVALDLEHKASSGFTFDEAMRMGLEYFPPK